MALNRKNLICPHVLLIGFVMALGLTSCGRSVQGRSKILSSQMSSQAKDEEIINVNFPALDVVPRLKYTAIKSVFRSTSDITQGANTKDIFLKLRAIASLTNAYHQELLEILKDAPVIDFSHVMLMVDSCYFPSVTYDLMLEFLSDPRSCGNLSSELCQTKMTKIKGNAKSAQEFGIFINEILLNGWSKLNQGTIDQASLLLKKSYPQLDSTNLLFKEVINALGDLSANEKNSLMTLAIQKSALNSAKDLALDWFKNDSDKTYESLLLTAKKLPPSDSRDEFLLRALDIVPSLIEGQAKEVVALALNPLKIAQTSLSKMNNFSVHELADIISLCKNSSDRDLLISLGVGKMRSVSSAEAVELLRQADKNKIQLAQTLIALIPHFAASDLAYIAQNAFFGQEREDLVIFNIGHFAILSAADARLIADQTGRNIAHIVLLLLPKINQLSGKDLAHVVEAIHFGPERDEVLLAGVKLVQTSSVDGDIAGLDLAYNSKLEVTTVLISKTASLTATDLASIVKTCLNGTTRDQLLIQGSGFVSQASVEGVIAMLGQADQEKVKVALAILPKMQAFSGRDLGTILQSIIDGPTRDRIIADGLSFIKKMDGDGAALIVERSFDFKAETAAKLLTLIPLASGTDLDKMLAVCGSGNIRDIILANGIRVLGKLTSLEAKSLYSRAYNNKESVAVALIDKVDNINGQTIGEMALFSNRGSVRDLIISEGLKRLAKIDTIGLIAMIKASDKLTESLVLDSSAKIANFVVSDAVNILDVIVNIALKDRFLIRSIDFIADLNEQDITTLALLASNQKTQEAIVRKGVDKIGDDL